MGTSWNTLRQIALPAVVVSALILAGCAGGRGGPVPYEPSYLGIPDGQAYPVAASSMPIGALDVVKITVFREQALSGDFSVDEAGIINYPLLGSLQAQGRSAQELGAYIAGKLDERYLKHPNVVVAVTQRAEQLVTVDGSVRQPGRFTIKGPTTLIRAVAMAQGTSEDANPSRVIVIRTINGERLAGAYDLRAIRNAQSADPVIYGNDIVVVDGSRGRALFKDILSGISVFGILRPF